MESIDAITRAPAHDSGVSHQHPLSYLADQLLSPSAGELLDARAHPSVPVFDQAIPATGRNLGCLQWMCNAADDRTVMRT